jgi:hypothetical protein
MNECVHCGYCCKQVPCQFGKWDKVKQQCIHLTEENLCCIYDFIKECGLGWEHNPAFGFGCCSTLNSDRRNILQNKGFHITR